MKNYFFENFSPESKKRILIIFTGGTISMIRDKKSGALVPAETLADLVKAEPELQNLADLDFLNLFNLDSSDINPQNWLEIAKAIEKEYDKYDGFVIAHGTDTMAYTASALSFLLENLGKPVVVTGSQFPLSGGMRTDARMNLFNSILFAKTDFAEVAVCFGNKLLRGNRSMKLNAVQLDAFDSPNFHSLGFADSKISLRSDCFEKHSRKVKVVGKMSEKTAIVKIAPGVSPEHFESVIEGFDGVVIEGFGSGGNIPQNLLPVLEKKIKDEKTVFALKSQCIIGDIDLSIYEGGNKAQKMGVLNCFDMTTEAAFCKLSWLLGEGFSVRKVKELFEKDLRGEVSLD